MSDSVRPHRPQPTSLPCPWDSPGKNTGVGCHFLPQSMKVKSESEVVQSCPTLRDPMDCSLPGSSIQGIFQARVLEWGAIAFSIYICVCVYIYIYITMSGAKFQIFSDTKESVAGIQEEVAWLCTSVVWREGQREGLGHGLGPD